jgi:DNA polymerase III subunit delta'
MTNNDLPSWLDSALARATTMPAHALLLHGPGPLGQLELGMAVARAALCESPDAHGRACGRCVSCHLFGARSHPDFLLLIPDALRERLGWSTAEQSEAKSKTKPSRDIKVDAVRAAIDWAQQTSFRGRAKVLLIHPAEAMNETAANALLKTLEEPPGRLRLLLTASDPEALLPTVRSRCQRVPIALPPPAEALAWLEGQGVPAAATLLAAAGGLPHAALTLHEDGIDAAAWSRVPALVRAGQAGALASWPVARVVEALHKLCHDLMALAAGHPARYFDDAALAPALRPALPSMTLLTGWDQALRLAARHDEHPWHAALRAEALVSQAAALWQTARAAPPGRGRPLDTLPGP